MGGEPAKSCTVLRKLCICYSRGNAAKSNCGLVTSIEIRPYLSQRLFINASYSKSFRTGCHLIVLIIWRGLVSTSGWSCSITRPPPARMQQPSLSPTYPRSHTQQHSLWLWPDSVHSFLPTMVWVAEAHPTSRTPRPVHYAPLATPSLRSRTAPPA